MNAKINEKILIGIAIVVFIGFQIYIGAIKQSMRNESRPIPIGLPQNARPVEVTVRTSGARTAKDFQSIHMGMSFLEVSRALRIKKYSKDLDAYFTHPRVLTKFVNPDGTSIEVIFRGGRATNKVQLTAREARAADAKRKAEE